MKYSLNWAFVLGFAGFITSFGAHIVAVNLPFYAEKIGIGLTMIGVLIAVYDFAEILASTSIGTVWTNSDVLISKLATENTMGTTMGVAGSFKELGDMICQVNINSNQFINYSIYFYFTTVTFRNVAGIDIRFGSPLLFSRTNNSSNSF